MKALKTTLLGVVLLMPYSLSAEIATPDWVKAKPSSMIYYTGVGSASLSDADYRESAKEKALADFSRSPMPTTSARGLKHPSRGTSW